MIKSVFKEHHFPTALRRKSVQELEQVCHHPIADRTKGSERRALGCDEQRRRLREPDKAYLVGSDSVK